MSFHRPYCINWRRHLGKDETQTMQRILSAFLTDSAKLIVGRRPVRAWLAAGPTFVLLSRSAWVELCWCPPCVGVELQTSDCW